MDSDRDEPGLDNTLSPSPSGFLDSENRPQAITSRDIDALVQLKLLRQRR